MTTYILLRSNKESGPYSIEQLRELGVKPNDLIWVEGQSASWRNPHEIPQLKDLAGQVPVLIPETPNTQQEEKSIATPKSETATCRKSAVFVAFPEKETAKTKAGGQVNSSRQETTGPARSSDIRFDEIKQEKPKEEVETKYAMSL